MPLPPLVKQLIEKKLSTYCQKKIPAHLHDQIRLMYKIRGNSVSLHESRPSFFKPDDWVEVPVAQFRYDSKENLWTLYCADRNSRWIPFTNVDPTRNFEKLLLEVDADTTGIFWG